MAPGIWQYELATEELSRRALQLRQLQHQRAQAALSTSLPSSIAMALAPIVAQFSGPELRRVAALAPHLTAAHVPALKHAAALDAFVAAASINEILVTAARDAALGDWLTGDGGAPPLLQRRSSLGNAVRDIEDDLVFAIRHQASCERSVPSLMCYNTRL
jgi:hypothetical protein